MNELLKINVIKVAELDGWTHEEGTDRLHKEGRVKDVLHYYYHLQLRDNLSNILSMAGMEDEVPISITTDEAIAYIVENLA